MFNINTEFILDRRNPRYHMGRAVNFLERCRELSKLANDVLHYGTMYQENELGELHGALGMVFSGEDTKAAEDITRRWAYANSLEITDLQIELIPLPSIPEEQ